MSELKNTIRILIVDDSDDLRFIMREYLRVEGDIIDDACNGTEALMKHTENAYDVIITDLKMPGITGIDLIKAVRKTNEITEFIIITGYASLDTAIDAIKNGAFDYIVKPFRMEELKIVVKNAKDKILLLKLNKELYRKLEKIYHEIQRYKANSKDGISFENIKRGEPDNDTERIIAEIMNLEKLIKVRLMIG